MPKAPASVADYLAALSDDQRAVVQGLRALALGAADGVTEQIKWNAPSFCIAGDDRITLGLDPKGKVRAILHRGVKAKDTTGFTFADPSGRVKWAAPDRGVVTFAGPMDFDQIRPAIGDLFAAWLKETA